MQSCPPRPGGSPGVHAGGDATNVSCPDEQLVGWHFRISGVLTQGAEKEGGQTSNHGYRHYPLATDFFPLALVGELLGHLAFPDVLGREPHESEADDHHKCC